MTEFAKRWREKIKPLVDACVPDQRAIEIIGLEEGDGLMPEEVQYLEWLSKKHKDLYGTYRIWVMNRLVEEAIEDEQESDAKNFIVEILNTLEDHEYFNNIFGGDDNNDEWKKLVALRKGLRSVLKLL